MPNIIVELMQERARVRKLLPNLDSLLRYHADRILREADIAMASNSIDAMKDSLADLQMFNREPKK
jgi:hypothetical protein